MILIKLSLKPKQYEDWWDPIDLKANKNDGDGDLVSLKSD
jgi:hypothetical protein